MPSCCSAHHRVGALNLTGVRAPVRNASRAETPWCAHTFCSRMGGRPRPRAAFSRSKKARHVQPRALQPSAQSRRMLSKRLAGTVLGPAQDNCHRCLPRSVPCTSANDAVAIRVSSPCSSATVSAIPPSLPSGVRSPTLGERRCCLAGSVPRTSAAVSAACTSSVPSGGPVPVPQQKEVEQFKVECSGRSPSWPSGVRSPP